MRQIRQISPNIGGLWGPDKVPKSHRLHKSGDAQANFTRGPIIDYRGSCILIRAKQKAVQKVTKWVLK